MYDVVTICNIIFFTSSGSLFSFSARHPDWLRMTKSLGTHRHKSVFGLKEFCVWFDNEKSCTLYREFQSKDHQSNRIAVFFYKGKIQLSRYFTEVNWLLIWLRNKIVNETFPISQRLADYWFDWEVNWLLIWLRNKVVNETFIVLVICNFHS